MTGILFDYARNILVETARDFPDNDPARLTFACQALTEVGLKAHITTLVEEALDARYEFLDVANDPSMIHTYREGIVPGQAEHAVNEFLSSTLADFDRAVRMLVADHRVLV